ncbi:hypothetical protein QAD02_019731 [Eretmocerus hayati]|uniref:Uncharacterized protein n=1 Tax=Eretmocerus hayati TaxID=131215 RepID=A0ACC2PKY5_9HYME|nr:hypothetical protein QAD02_019731 [Eretmocerus hayati]
MLKDYSPRSGEDSNEYREGQRRPWLGRRSAVLPEGLPKVLIADYCAQESVSFFLLRAAYIPLDHEFRDVRPQKFITLVHELRRKAIKMLQPFVDGLKRREKQRSGRDAVP